jgi:hypothetical protein
MAGTKSEYFNPSDRVIATTNDNPMQMNSQRGCAKQKENASPF